MDLTRLYNDIKTPDELLMFMEKHIKYGFYGNDGKIYTTDGTEEDNHEFNNASFTKYGLADKGKVLKYGYGQCFDQTEFERAWFKGHNYEFKTIFIWFLFDYENTYPTHSYLIYHDKETDEYCWFEHADYYNKGIHRFKSYEGAIYFQMKKHLEYTKKMGHIVTDKELGHLHIYEFDEPKSDISFDEYLDYVMNAKDITTEIVGEQK